MKVAIIGTRGYPYAYSGYETFARELGEKLTAKGVSVTIYCHRGLFRERPRQVNGINLVYIPTIEHKILSQFVHTFQAMIHACFRRYDAVLVVNSANGPFGLFTKLGRIRTAINVDGLEWLRPKWRGLGARYFHLASRLATRLYDRVVTDSIEMQKVYQGEFGCESTMIAYGAVIYPPSDPGVLSVWGLSHRGYHLIAGRLIPDNNIDLIVRAFCSSSSNRRLVFAGDMPFRDRFASTIKANPDPRLLFTGYVRDPRLMAALYQHCDLYLHGHEFGGTNPAMLEGLASGCAICALDTPFSREMLQDGEYGVFFPKDENRLRELIEEMEKEPERLAEMRRQAPERIRNAYTWEKITDQYCQLFADLLKK